MITAENMNYCKIGHKEIHYTGNGCPVCERDNEIKRLEDVVSIRDGNIAFLKQLLADFKAALFSLSQKFETIKERERK